MSPDFVIRTGPTTLRMPDVSILCGVLDDTNRRLPLIGDPRVVFEVLSPSTSAFDQRVKIIEYCALDGLDALIFVDPVRQCVRFVERTSRKGWSDQWLESGSDVTIASLGIVVTHEDIFDLS